MSIKLDPVLADLRSWKPDGCPVTRALDVIGPHTSVLILREAFYGTTRFDLFVERVGVTEAAAAARLRQLTEAGLLRRAPYREPGSRTRHEYLLTDKGRDLMPAVLALFQWGSAHLQPEGAPLSLVEDGSGAPVRVAYVDAEGREVAPEDLRMAYNRGSLGRRGSRDR